MSELHCERYGPLDGAPLLAIHGVTGHARRFERLANQAWSDRRVLSVDLRGHGRSTSDAPWHLEQHVTDVLDTLSAQGWDDPVDVVGHSFGGAIATFLLALAPRRVRRLVLLDPALHTPGPQALANAEAALAFEGHATVEDAAAARRVQLPEAAHDVIDAELEAHLVESPDGRFRYRFAVAPVVAAWGEMARVTPIMPLRRPTLLVLAAGAQICGPAYVAALREALGGALTIVELDCGHMVYWERFDDTAKLVAEFLGAEVPGR